MVVKSGCMRERWFAQCRVRSEPEPLKRACQILLVLMSCLHLCGGSLGFLQLMAWAGMAVTYTAESGVAEGLKETFDGEHPCPLCVAIAAAEGKESEPGEPGAPLPQSIERLAKQVIWLAEAGMPLMPEVVEGVVVLPEVLELSGRGVEMPPVPPPRGLA
jgi:hypothetical protein